MYENKLDDIGNKNMIQEGFEDMKSKIPNPNQLSDTDYDAEDEMAYSPPTNKSFYNHTIAESTRNEEVEIRHSTIHEGNSAFSLKAVACGHKFGPFQGILKDFAVDKSCAWEIVDETGRVKGWLDGSDAPPSAWMKHVASTDRPGQQNLIAVQVADDVFYKTTRAIAAGEELMLNAKAGVYQEKDLQYMDEIVRADPKYYPCKECGEMFKSKVALRRHETYVCKNENAIFATKPRMEKETSAENIHNLQSRSPSDAHLKRTSTLEKQDMFPIDIPEKAPVTPGKLFYCENCPLVYYDVDSLSEHIREAHEGARSFPCPECGKTFATSSGLKQHQHIHSSVKPFQCEVCFKAYTQFSNLCRHKRMHAGCRQKITCNKCNQPFASLHSLNKHKPFCAKNAAAESVRGNGITAPDAFRDGESDLSQKIHDTYNRDRTGYAHDLNASNRPPLDPSSLFMNGMMPMPYLPPLYVNTNQMMPGMMTSHMRSMAAAMMLSRYGNQQEMLMKQQQLMNGFPSPSMTSRNIRTSTPSSDENTERAPATQVKTERNGRHNSVGESNEGSTSDTNSDKKVVTDENDRKSESPDFDIASYPVIKKESPQKAIVQPFRNDEPKNSPQKAVIQPFYNDAKVNDAPMDLTCADKNTVARSKKTHIFDTQVPSPQAIRSESPYEFKKYQNGGSPLPGSPASRPLSLDTHNPAQNLMYTQAMRRLAKMIATSRDSPAQMMPPIPSLNIDTAYPYPAIEKLPPGFIDSGNKTCVCRYCANVFPSSFALASHLIKHTGENCFARDDEAVEISRILKSGLSASDVDMQCGICHMTFTKPHTMLKHIEKHVHQSKMHKELSPNSFAKHSEQLNTDESDSEEMPTKCVPRFYEDISPVSNRNQHNNISYQQSASHESPSMPEMTHQALDTQRPLDQVFRKCNTNTEAKIENENALKRKSPTRFPVSSPLTIPKKRRLLEQFV